MEKDILVLIRISINEISITAIEKFNTSNIEIFSDKFVPEDAMSSIEFVKNAIKKIEKLIFATIKEVSVIFDATSFAKIKQKLISENISNLNNKKISELHFESALEKVKEYYKMNNSKEEVPILFQPFQFNLTNEDDQVKTYSVLPIGKTAKKLETLFSVTTLERSHYQSAMNICTKAGLKISQIYSSSNVSPYILESDAKKNISITMQIEKHYSNLIITNNGVTVVTKNLKYTFEDLCKKIAYEFNISKKIVYELIVNEGIITKNDEKLNKIIFHKKNMHIKAFQLTAILKSFVKTLIEEVDEFIKNKHKALKSYTLNVIGRIEGIAEMDEYCKSILPNNNISVNNRPINFLLLKYNNRPIFGLTKLLENINRTINANTVNINTKPGMTAQKSWMKPLYKKSNAVIVK
ncbi:MAG: MAG3720 family protein [Metamycoplasmataceae bacterium]